MRAREATVGLKASTTVSSSTQHEHAQQATQWAYTARKKVDVAQQHTVQRTTQGSTSKKQHEAEHSTDIIHSTVTRAQSP